MTRAALVTGASAGIGRESAIALAGAGYAVGICYASDEDGGRETAARCPEGAAAAVVRLDVTDPGSVSDGLRAVESALGPVHLLVNNAGVFHRAPFARLTPDEVRSQVEVNLLGLMSVTAAVLPGMLERGDGIILNVGSAMTARTHPDASIYTATKHGVHGFTQALATELPDGVRVYCVNPAMTSTRMTEWKGADPADVARVLVGAAREEYGKHSGDDVNMWEYIEWESHWCGHPR